MKRRTLLISGLAAGKVGTELFSQNEPAGRSWFELRFFHLRNDFERTRLDSILKNTYLPISKRLDFGPVGFFNISIGPGMPTLVSLTSYRSLAAMESTLDQLANDLEWNRALDAFSKPKESVYSRIESWLLRAFSTMPRLEEPARAPSHSPRLFELRVYESRNFRASLTKIKMFEEGEIQIFRKTGLLPVFFAQTIVGSGLPSLTYLLAHDSAEAREESWRRFLKHPDWIKLRAVPGYSDSEIVSNINSFILRPTDYSPIQ